MLAAILAMAGCAGWQATSAKVLSGLTKAGKEAHGFVIERCGKGGIKVAKKCLAAKDGKCAPLKACEKAVRVLRAAQTAVLVAKLSVQSADRKDAELAVLNAVRAMQRVVKEIKEWAW